MDETTRKTTFVHLALSPDQQALVKRSTGRDSEALRLTIEDLEQRIVPGLTTNANSTMLVEPLEERIAPTLGTKLAVNENESLLVEPLEDRIAPRQL